MASPEARMAADSRDRLVRAPLGVRLAARKSVTGGTLSGSADCAGRGGGGDSLNMHGNPWGELIEYFHSQSDWRAQKAKLFPNDARNQRAAEALGQLCMDVQLLAHNDPRVVAVVEFASGPIDYLVHLDGMEGRLDAVSRRASRIGFTNRPVDLDRELTRYVTDCLADQIRELEQLADACSESERDLYDNELPRLRRIQLRLLNALEREEVRCRASTSDPAASWPATRRFQAGPSAPVRSPGGRTPRSS
jgi:hypothetical protein